jgi:hypothetical protein
MHMVRSFLLCLLLFGSNIICLAQSTPDQEVTMCSGDTVTMSATVINADSLQWYRNEVAIPGANQDTLVYLDGGLFYLRAFRGDNKTCIDQSGDIRVFIAYPKTNDDHILVPLGKPVTFDVLENDEPFCAPFDKNTFTILSQPTIGTLTSYDKGVIVYKPSATTIGQDRFTYSIKDVDGRVANEATVYLELYIDCAMLYPNPVEQVLNVTVNNKRIHALKIYDAMGRELYRTVVSGTAFTIDMSDYAQGIYIVDLLEHDGSGCTFKIQKK